MYAQSLHMYIHDILQNLQICEHNNVHVVQVKVYMKCTSLYCDYIT